jgi:hypothetical protein
MERVKGTTHSQPRCVGAVGIFSLTAVSDVTDDGRTKRSYS